MWKPSTASHQLATFVVHWASASGDKTYLFEHVTSQHHMTEVTLSSDGSKSCYGWVLLTVSGTLVTIAGHKHCDSGELMWPNVKTCLKDHVILWVEAHHRISPPCQVLWPYAMWQWKCWMFLSLDLTRSCEQSVT